MYADYSPVPNSPVNRVIVLEGNEDANNVIEEARDEGAVTEDGDGDEIFWIVFANDPRRLVDFTERSLRRELKKKPQPV